MFIELTLSDHHSVWNQQIEYVCLFFKCVLSVSFELLPLIEEIDDR